MFVLPLGLQAKTRDFPWATLVILVVTAVVSVLSFEAFDHLEEARNSHPLSIERLNARKSLAIAACPTSGLAKADCEKITDFLKAEDGETRRAFGRRIQKESEEFTPVQLDFFRDYVIERHVSAEMKALPQYETYREAVKAENEFAAAHARENAFLTRASFGVWPLLRAQLQHGGWMHLLGNMIFFLIFAIPLEQRVGRAAIFGIYFIGGSAGLMLDLLLSQDFVRPVVGASANVSAVAAAFLVAFFAHRMRVWVSFVFAFNRVVLLPTWLFLAAFFVAQDVAGVVGTSDDGIAHWAHLGGFLFGGILGFLAILVGHKVPRGFAFPFEVDLYLRSRDASIGPEKRLGYLRAVLEFNASNDRALLDAWKIALMAPDLSWAQMLPMTRIFFTERLGDLVIRLKTTDKKEMSGLLFSLTRVFDWPWGEVVPERDRSRLMNCARELAAEGLTHEAEILRQLVSMANEWPAKGALVVEKRSVA